MSEKAFRIVLLILVGIGVLLTVAHIVYLIQAYQHCSIIYFIGKELW